jgi:hypothetical protein
MKILVDGFFRSASRYTHYVFQNAYPEKEIFYGYPLAHYGIESNYKNEFDAIAVVLRDPKDTLISICNEFNLIDNEEKTFFYLNMFKGFLNTINQNKNDIYICKFNDIVSDPQQSIVNFSIRFPEFSVYSQISKESILEQITLGDHLDILPKQDQDQEKNQAELYLNQEKFSAKLAELNSLYNMIIE